MEDSLSFLTFILGVSQLPVNRSWDLAFPFGLQEHLHSCRYYNTHPQLNSLVTEEQSLLKINLRTEATAH